MSHRNAADPRSSCTHSPTHQRHDRRSLLRLAGAAALATAWDVLLPAGAHAATGAAGGPRRIDVHHHIVPPALLAAGQNGGLNPGALTWNLSRALEDMDRLGIATGVTSIPDLADWGTGATYARLIRECNDYAARIRDDHRGRFGMFASLPWPDVDASLKEVAYAFDTLKADGVFLWTSYGNHWFGDPRFAPLLEELDRRRAIVYTHPRSADCCRAPGQPIDPGVIEWQTDTTRALAEWLFTGAQQKYAQVRPIFSHGGGTMTSLVGRLINAADSASGRTTVPDGFIAAAKRCWFDTSLQIWPAQLWPMKNIVGVERLLFGSDYPFSTAAGRPVQKLKESGVFTAAELRAIDRGNAAKLFPGYA